MTDEEREETYAIYVDSLSEIPREILLQATKEHINNERFFPKISELRHRSFAIVEEQRAQQRAIEHERYQLERQRQETQRIFPPEEAKLLLHGLYESLVQQKAMRQAAEQDMQREMKAEYADRQKRLARSIIEREKENKQDKNGE